MVPTHIFLTRGVGVHKEKLASFEEALRSAGVAYLNLVTVSSILPPNCKILPRARGEKLLSPGEITFCVMARSETNERNRLISASIGLAVPTDRRTYGYLSEHHAHGETDEETGEYTEDLSITPAMPPWAYLVLVSSLCVLVRIVTVLSGHSWATFKA